MPYVDHRRSRIGTGLALGRPTWNGRAMRGPPLAQFVLLSMLLHALAIALFGAPAGGSREGRAMWGALQVTLAGAPREEAPPLKIERHIATPPAPKPRVRHRRAPSQKVEPPSPPSPPSPPAPVEIQPMQPIAPLPALDRAAPFVPPLLDRIVTPEPRTEPPPLQVPLPTMDVPPPREVGGETAVEPPPARDAPPTPPVAAPPIEAKPLPVPEAAPTPPVAAPPIEAKPLPVPEESTKAPEIARPAESEPAIAPATVAPATPARETTAPSPPAHEVPRTSKIPATPATPSPAQGEPLFEPAAPASAYDPTAPGPALDLDAIRRRAGEIAREGSGQRAPLPFPMPPVPPRKSALEKAIDDARKPDCRTAYQSLGLAAVVPLIANEFGEGNCRW